MKITLVHNDKAEEWNNAYSMWLAREHFSRGVLMVNGDTVHPVSVERTLLAARDPEKASILLAVLEKRIGLELFDRDVFLNVVGGLELSEPSADLGLVAAIASSFFNKPISPETMFIGEIGLTGEVRSVSRIEERLREAAAMGFKRCINF